MGVGALVNYEKYEEKLKESLTWDYLLLIFMIIVIIGLTVFVLWWNISEKKELGELQLDYNNNKIKIPVIVSVTLLTLVIIGATYNFISSIIKKNYDINNKAYIVVSEDFIVTEENWLGRWNSKTYTIEFERDEQIMTIHPDLKYTDLSIGEHTDLIFVYSLKSEIVLDVFGKTGEDRKTGDGSVS